MMMTHRERLETAWQFRQPDRVPIEISIPQSLRDDPRAARLAALIDEHADNFAGLPSPGAGFLGLPSEYREEVIEDRPGEYRLLLRVHETAVGTFVARTRHPADTDDYRWEKRYIATLEDMARIADAPREPMPWDRDAYVRRLDELDGAGLPSMGLFHPLGNLVRSSAMEEMYTWLATEPALVHRFLAAANAQVVATLETLEPVAGSRLTFMTWAHEMLIPPWMGRRRFDEFVVPYDREVNAAIHRRGGRLRAHCHGNSMEFLVRFAEMGIDATEPLDGPPGGDVDLAEAKRRVGDRMMLSGNIPSERFVRMDPSEVRDRVRAAIRAAAPGGGFSLRTSGGHAGAGIQLTDDQLVRVLANCEAYIEAGLEFGRYPIDV